MDDWLTQLDMEWNNEEMSLNNNNMQYDHQIQQGMETLNEELALILGNEFPSPICEEKTLFKVPSNLSISNDEQQLSPPNCNLVVNNNNTNNVMSLPQEDSVVSASLSKSKESKQKDGNGKMVRKRKREPNQIYDHILAERKRRELLSQLFIALSAILPGLKKVDKTSILGEAIRHMKHLKEKVKTLEEEAAAAKQNVESMVMVKRSKLVVDNDDDDSSCTVEDEHTASGAGAGGGGGGMNNNGSNLLPEIEVKVSDKTLLLRLCCEKIKGISAQILAQVEKHDIVILHTNMMPFGTSLYNFTIIGQTEKIWEKKRVKNLVKSLHSILHNHTVSTLTKY